MYTDEHAAGGADGMRGFATTVGTDSCSQHPQPQNRPAVDPVEARGHPVAFPMPIFILQMPIVMLQT